MLRGAGLGFHGIGRLKPGVTVEQARADMARVTANLALAFPNDDRGVGASIAAMKEQMVGSKRSFLMVLLARCGICAADRVRECSEPDAGARLRTRP